VQAARALAASGHPPVVNDGEHPRTFRGKFETSVPLAGVSVSPALREVAETSTGQFQKSLVPLRGTEGSNPASSSGESATGDIFQKSVIRCAACSASEKASGRPGL